MIKYITAVKPSSASGLVRGVYAQVERDFGRVVEPFQLHSPLPELLAGAWMACRESELVGSVPRNLKEVVAACVSQLNNCSYCVDAHTIMLSAMGEGKTANAISRAHYEDITDEKTFTVVQWALATTSPNSELLHWPPFSKQEAPEFIGTAVFYHYINRMANALLGETPLPLSQSWLRSPLKSIASQTFSNALNRPKIIGESLGFLPESKLPSDLKWAKPDSNIARAYTRFAKAVEDAGEKALPIEVRGYINEELSEWTGKTSELSLAWSEDAISHFEKASESSARLAVQTALAPDRIETRAISDFKKDYPEDTKLLGVLAWASFAAARKIGTWLHS
ncbi:MAG TPA: carboxymuconolactone decarboxylase family protein [Candidatus Nanoarchaeia archaeon]|nr:carboxymuconolactone decarboxylase family protein [Candidatus Nanoarchaeia archaeon]